MSSDPVTALSTSAQSRISTAADNGIQRKWYKCHSYHHKYPTLDLIIQFIQFHSAYLAQMTTLVISLLVLVISLVAYFDDANWNAELRTSRGALIKALDDAFRNASSNKPFKPNFVFRERREFIVSMLVQGYVILVIMLHLLNYWILSDHNYRITFGKLFNFGLILIYTSSLLLILEGTVEINSNYDELRPLAIFRCCRIGGDQPDTNKTKIQETSMRITLKPAQKGLLCHRYDLRFAAIGLSLVALCIMLGILLFSRNEAENADQHEMKEDFFDDKEEDSRIHLVLEKDVS